MGMVWDYDLDHAQQLILLAMADHADHEGNNIYPSIGRLAWKTGYSSRQVQRIINQLIEIHAIECQTKRGTKTNNPHHYRITLENVPKKKPFEPKKRQNVTPDKMSPGGDIAMSGEGCHSYVTQIINEPSMNLNTVASPPLPPPTKDEIPIPDASKIVATTPRQPGTSPKLPPVQAKALVPSKPVINTEPLTGAAARKAPPPAPSSNGRKEQRSDVFFNALADGFYGGARNGNSMVGRALWGKKDGSLVGIVAHEEERQRTTRDALDYRALAAMVPKFKAWFVKENDGKSLQLRDPEKLITWWESWRNTTNRVDCPPKLFYDPNCKVPGCDKGRVYRFDEKGMVIDADDCICVTLVKMERQGIKL